MNRDEAIAEIYLRGLDMGDVVHEPDGRVTPDFVVNGRVAVEVRRLNQQALVDGVHEGLEIAEAGILAYFDRLLPTLGGPIDGRSWFVFYSFRRPLDWKALKRDIKSALTAFVPEPEKQVVKLRRNFELDLQPASHPHSTRFLLGGYSDHQAGGFVSSEIIRNANLCIAEKSEKTRQNRPRYPEWWLLLVDRIGPKLNAFERNDLPNHVKAEGWDRVVLLDPDDPDRALRLDQHW